MISLKRGSPVMSCCGARNFNALPCKISTAATPYFSLNLPPAALENVPTSIRLRIYFIVNIY